MHRRVFLIIERLSFINFLRNPTNGEVAAFSIKDYFVMYNLSPRSLQNPCKYDEYLSLDHPCIMSLIAFCKPFSAKQKCAFELSANSTLYILLKVRIL